MKRAERKKRAAVRRDETKVKIFMAMRQSYEEDYDNVGCQQAFRDSVYAGETECQRLCEENPKEDQMITRVLNELVQEITGILVGAFGSGADIKRYRQLYPDTSV